LYDSIKVSIRAGGIKDNSKQEPALRAKQKMSNEGLNELKQRLREFAPARDWAL